jgi:hypothetical protein
MRLVHKERQQNTQRNCDVTSADQLELQQARIELGKPDFVCRHNGKINGRRAISNRSFRVEDC